jgi:predicted AAA+ superfamily ATPase
VLNELEARGAEVGYVKTADGLEVDFLARRPAAGEELIQVCADVSSPETRTRELRALAAAAAEHPLTAGTRPRARAAARRSAR